MLQISAVLIGQVILPGLGVRVLLLLLSVSILITLLGLIVQNIYHAVLEQALPRLRFGLWIWWGGEGQLLWLHRFLNLLAHWFDLNLLAHWLDRLQWLLDLILDLWLDRPRWLGDLLTCPILSDGRGIYLHILNGRGLLNLLNVLSRGWEWRRLHISLRKVDDLGEVDLDIVIVTAVIGVIGPLAHCHQKVGQGGLVKVLIVAPVLHSRGHHHVGGVGQVLRAGVAARGVSDEGRGRVGREGAVPQFVGVAAVEVVILLVEAVAL